MTENEDFAPPAEAIDIGGGHRIVFRSFEGELAGIDDWHRRPDGSWCKGWIDFAGSKWVQGFNGAVTGWTVEHREPLTLSPSLLCRVCGDHGFIREGRWVKA